MASEISKYLNENIKLKVLTRLDNESMRQKAQDPEALIVFKENFSNLEIKILDDLHAKIYLFDNKKALVTSANLTVPAFNSNIEYGVLLDKPEEIEPVIENVNELYSKATRFEDYESKILSSLNQPKRTRVRHKGGLSDAIKSIDKTSFSPLERSEVVKAPIGVGEENSKTIFLKPHWSNSIIEFYNEGSEYNWNGHDWIRLRKVSNPMETIPFRLDKVNKAYHDAQEMGVLDQYETQLKKEAEETEEGGLQGSDDRRYPQQVIKGARNTKLKLDLGRKEVTYSLNAIEPINFNNPRINKIRRLKLGDVIELDSKNDYDSNYGKFNLSGKYKIISSKAYKFNPDKKRILIIEEKLDNDTETEFTRKSEPLKRDDYVDNCWSKVEDGVCNWITASLFYLGIASKEDVSKPDDPELWAVFKYNSGTKLFFPGHENKVPDTWVRLRSIETDRDITLSEKQLIKFIS
jgi:hypothetical protein